jgi:hypothetical protein
VAIHAQPSSRYVTDRDLDEVLFATSLRLRHEDTLHAAAGFRTASGKVVRRHDALSAARAPHVEAQRGARAPRGDTDDAPVDERQPDPVIWLAPHVTSPVGAMSQNEGLTTSPAGR